MTIAQRMCSCTSTPAILLHSRVCNISVASKNLTCSNRVHRAVDCQAELPPAPKRWSQSQAPSGLHKRKCKTAQSVHIQPQSVQLRDDARPSSKRGNGRYKAARHRLTVALLEQDVDAAIDAVSEARALASLECLPSTSASLPREATPAHFSEMRGRDKPLLPPPTSAISIQPTVSATDAFANREHSTSVAQQVSVALGGLHARFIRMCLRNGKPQAAFNYVVILPTSKKMHGSLMNEISKHGSKQHVEAALELRELFQLPMDKFTLCSALCKLSADGCTDEVHALYAHYRDSMATPLDTYVFNTVLSTHAAAGDTERFDDVWSDMHQAGCSPTHASHACHVKLLLAAHGPDAALELYREMSGDPTDVAQRARAACMVSPQLYTTVFMAVAAGTRDSGAVSFATLWAIWRDMIELRVPVDDQLAGTFLYAAKGMTLTPREVETCFGILATLCANRVKPGVGTLCNLLQVCARNDTSARVIDIWALVEADRLRVTPHTLSAALACCARCVQECPEIPSLAMRLEGQLRERWMDATLWPGGPRTSSNFRVAFNAVLAYHASAGRFDHGLATWQFMRESGPHPDAHTFCAMLHVCGSTGHAAHAQRMLSEMHAAGIAPNVRAFCGVLDACAKAQDVERAWEVLRSMPAHGVNPNVVGYTCVMDACVREGSPESLAQVPEIMDTMRAEGMQPSAVTYGCALAACDASHDAAQAFRLYHEACDAGVLPTDNLHNALIKVCVSAGNLDEALEQIKSLIRGRGHMQQHAMNSLTRALSEQFIDRALYMLRFMRRGKITPTHKTFHALIAGCAREAMPDVGLSLYIEMRACGHLPSSRSGSPLIEALSQAGRLEAALRVLQDMAQCADGSRIALAQELSVLGGQPQDSNIYGSPGHAGSGVGSPPQLGAREPTALSTSQQLQQLVASLPQLELSYRIEHDVEKRSPAPASAAHTSPRSGVSGVERQHVAQFRDGHTAAAPRASQTRERPEDSGTVPRDTSSCDHSSSRRRGWGWAGGAAAQRLPSSLPGNDQKRSSARSRDSDSTKSGTQSSTEDSGRSRSRSRPKRGQRRCHELRKSDMLPTIEAVAALVLGSALASEARVAEELYVLLRRQGSAALSRLLPRGSRVFELLMEGFCRSGRVKDALAVFDDWKAARDLIIQQYLHQSNSGRGDLEHVSGAVLDAGGRLRPPKLSNVTLAYLEASCHACSDEEDVQWRVYDVCALMRQQQEDSKTRKLLHPKKGSHHVKEAW